MKHHSSPSGHRRKRKHRHSVFRRIRRWIKKRPWLFPAAALLLVALLGALWWMRGVLQRQNALQIDGYTATNTGVDLGYHNLTWQGKNYRYNSRIKTILYAGVDSDGALETFTSYSVAPRADSISLVVLDEKHDKISIIALSRDTMTDVRKFTLEGKDRGLFTDHLGYAFTYGDGGKASGKNLAESVSRLLGGIPVNEYIVTNRGSLQQMMNILGPVTVTVPNNELAGIDPQMQAGAQIDITAENIELYVRQRDIADDLSNVGRMQRQQTFINSVIYKIKSELTDSLDSLWEQIMAAEESMLTSITRNKYLDLAILVKNLDYQESDYYQLPGENVVGKEHDEFYPDQDGVMQLVIDLFYEER